MCRNIMYRNKIDEIMQLINNDNEFKRMVLGELKPYITKYILLPFRL
jgi:hypothetical protein